MSVIVPLIDQPDAGVIHDARDRQRRRHEAGRLVSLAMLLVGVLAYTASGGGASGVTSAQQAPPAVTFVSLHTPGVRVVASPSLTAGAAGLCVIAAGFASYGNCQTPAPYPQAGIPFEATEGGVPIVAANLERRVALKGSIYLLLTAPDVAAVRVGDLGTIPAQAAPGLPPGDRVVAFRVAARSTATFRVPGQLPQGSPPHPTHAIALTALDGSGRPISFASAAALNRLWLPLWPHVSWPAGEFTAGPNRACAVTAGNRTAAGDYTYGITAEGVAPQPAAAPSAFLTCERQWDVVRGTSFEVSVLLNARHPSRPAAPLWGAEPVPSHQGIVEIRAPSPLWEPESIADSPRVVEIRASRTQPAEIVARRVGNAWLTTGAVLAGTAPTLKQTLGVLASLHITRLDTGRS
jgi:hypothetical protein